MMIAQHRRLPSRFFAAEHIGNGCGTIVDHCAVLVLVVTTTVAAEDAGVGSMGWDVLLVDGDVCGCWRPAASDDDDDVVVVIILVESVVGLVFKDTVVDRRINLEVVSFFFTVVVWS